MTDLQGFYVTLSLDGTDITARLESVDLERTKNVKKKSVMDGTPGAEHLATEHVSALAMVGFVDEAGMEALEATYAKNTEVPYSLFVGDATAGLDAGTYTGNITLARLMMRSTTDDNWRFEMNGDGGSVVYTPPVP